MRYRLFIAIGVIGIVGFYLSKVFRNLRSESPLTSGTSSPTPQAKPTLEPPVTKPRMVPSVASKAMPPSDPPGTSESDQRKLRELCRSIKEDGRPRRDEAIPRVRAFLESSDPRVRYEAAKMLYEMKDRSGYKALLELLNSPTPIISKEVDLQAIAASVFARYRERQAGPDIFAQYEKTKSLEILPAALALRLPGMVPSLHESLKTKPWVDSLASLAVLDAPNSYDVFRRVADNERAAPEQRAAAIFGLAMNGKPEDLERLIVVATTPKEVFQTNQDNILLAQQDAVRYLSNFHTERVAEVFEGIVTSKKKDPGGATALVFLRYRYPQNEVSREIIKSGLQPNGADLGWDLTFLLQLARLSGDPELIALGRRAESTTAFREFDVRAGWSNAWIGELLPDWEGDWP